jgi:hypothetical protein
MLGTYFVPAPTRGSSALTRRLNFVVTLWQMSRAISDVMASDLFHCVLSSIFLLKDVSTEICVRM